MARDLTPLNTKAFAVSKSWDDKEHLGAKVIPCKLLTYVNIQHKIVEIYQTTNGKKHEITEESHYIYERLEDAVDSIRSRGTRRKK